MISDDEVAELPDDPQLAFVALEKILRKQVQEAEYEANADSHYPGDVNAVRLEYITRMLAAARVYNIEQLSKQHLPHHSDGKIYDVYQQFTGEIDFLTMQIRLLRRPAERAASVGLDGNTKRKIHHYVQQIREAIEAAGLPEDKRDALYDKLNKFVLEVDKARTPVGSFGGFFVSVCGYVGDGFNKLKPVKEMINSISTLMGNVQGAEEDLLKLTQQDAPKQLSAPPRQLPAPAADESDIPF